MDSECILTVSVYDEAGARKPTWTGSIDEFIAGNPDLDEQGLAELRKGWAWTFGGGAEAEVLVLPHHELDAVVAKHTTWRGAADMIRDAFATFPCRVCRGTGKAHDVACEGCEGKGRCRSTYFPSLVGPGKGVGARGADVMALSAIADYYDAVMKAQGDPRRAYRGGL